MKRILKWEEITYKLKTLMLINIYNYKNFLKIFSLFCNPFLYIFAIISRKVPDNLTLNTPIGKVNLAIRNYESLRTIFSIFCRGDYTINQSKKYTIMDVGANCGYSALYFLSRNQLNKVICYEPDLKNVKFLEKNLTPFKDRSIIYTDGIGKESGKSEFFLTGDGKYNSLYKSKHSSDVIDVNILSFNNEIDKCSLEKHGDLIIKIDVEGLEEDLIKSIDFEEKKCVSQVIVESKNCSKHINRTHKRNLINGYVEHIIFN